MITVGKKAPLFSGDAVKQSVVSKISLTDFDQSYKLLFFYPLDFTFVCPTELHALEVYKKEFEARNVVLLASSVDSVYSHLAWLATPKEQGGIQGVSYYLVSDIHKNIARQYGVLNEDAGVALRGVFLIDKENIVQYACVHNLSLGRNIAELIRVVDSLIHVEQKGEVCPVNWTSGSRGMKATQEGVVEYFQKIKQV